MGYGDEIMGSGMARGLLKKMGRRAAFGDGTRIIWSPHSYEIYAGNENVARPGSEGRGDLVWFPHYRGCRMYAEAVGGRWVWNEEFRAQPGELFLTDDERAWAERVGRGFVLIEPSVKGTAPNKQWPLERYQEVARAIQLGGHEVIQFDEDRNYLDGVRALRTPSFRHALAVLERAALYVGPEGGLHHGAAALGVRAVVIFGGFIHPKTTGYEGHSNLFHGPVACGTIGRLCPHCVRSMAAISTAKVISEIRRQFQCRTSGGSTSPKVRSTSSSSSKRARSSRAGRRISSTS